MFSPSVVLREAYFDAKLKAEIAQYAESHSISTEEATQSPTIQDYVKRHSEI